VLGDQAMNKLAISDVLLCGCGALGIEIGKLFHAASSIFT
jgi:hypothetical protein